jgi:predicted acyl esterase
MTNSNSKPSSSPAVKLIYPREIVKPALPPLGVKLDENVYVTMRDGIKVAVDIYRPEADGKYPCLFSTSAYMKSVQQHPPQYTHMIEAGATDFFVPRGYVHVIAQARGTGYSQGRYGFLDKDEQQDGYDLIEWIARQPWCDGNVGMIGDSYFAMIQYLIAALNPPHLKCIVPYDGCTDFYRDFTYQGGIFHGGFNGPWGIDTLLQAVWPGEVEGKLPPANWFVDLASNPHDGPYYWERSSYNKVDKIKVPVLNIIQQAGYLHSRGQLSVYNDIKAPKKLIVAPTAGYFAHVHWIYNKPLNEYVLRWLDYWLKGDKNGIMEEPGVAIYDSATREWRYENEYPLARTSWAKFYLHSSLNGSAGESKYGSLSMESPEDEKPDRFTMPDSTGMMRQGKPVLSYVSSPLDKDIRVWGPLSLTLYGSSSAIDTNWFVKLGDIDENGKLLVLTQFHLRASCREVDAASSKPGQPFHPFLKQELLKPGQVYEFQIELIPIFHTFKAGHKMWLHIAGDRVPEYHLPLHTPNLQLFPEPTENLVYHDSGHPSHLVLPVIPDAAPVKPVEPPLSLIYWPYTPGRQTDEISPEALGYKSK